MTKGKIIYLEGVSSSGKSTLSRTLQSRLSEPYFWIAGDFLWYIAPPPGIFDNDVIFSKVESATMNTVKLYSELGIGVIFDIVPVGKSYIIEQFSKAFHECPVLYVGVTCPLEELRRREKGRGDRRIGLSESQIASMASQDEYDITVDTYANSSEECADNIIKLLDYPEKFTAFNNFLLQRTE